jgi:hypothetical protein
MLANLKIICQFQAHSVHQNSVEIFWAEIYRGRLLTLITGSSSRLLRIRFSSDLTMYWFPVYHFRCMKFKPLVIWIWNQNIAISTIVGTSSHIIFNFKCTFILCLVNGAARTKIIFSFNLIFSSLYVVMISYGDVYNIYIRSYCLQVLATLTRMLF